MKSNGKRRWRSWAKNRRKQVYGDQRCTYTSLIAFYERRHGKKLLPLYTFAAAPKSLVGMSMSARKRAARMWLWPEDNRRDGLLAFREMIAEAPAVKVEYHLARSPYGIGKSLKPCPGCTGCSIWTIREKKPQQFVGRWVPKTQEDRDDPVFLEQILQLLDLVNACSPQDQRTSLDPICDGSGTLPAGKKKPR